MHLREAERVKNRRQLVVHSVYKRDPVAFGRKPGAAFFQRLRVTVKTDQVNIGTGGE